ncbi:MAG: response regulator [Pseudomonadota bacterium]
MIDLIAIGAVSVNCAHKLAKSLEQQGIRLVAESTQTHDAMQLLRDFKHDVVLLDFASQAGEQVALIQLLRIGNPATKILLVAEQTPDEVILDGLSAGAKGYLEHEACGVFLAKAIDAIAMGEVWISRRMAAVMVERLIHLTDQTRADARISKPGLSKLLH